MKSRSNVAAALLAITLAGCAHGGHPESTASLPPMLIDQRGITMPLQDAVKEIAFRPYVPTGTLAFAVIPPLGGADTRRNRGLAAEYASSRMAFVLSEWPKQHFDLAFPHKDITNTPCDLARFSSTGLAWTSRRGLLMTLQPDGNMSPHTVDVEARRLLRAGAC